MSSLTDITRSLRHRNYRLFFYGQGTSLIGTWMTRLATSWLVYRLTHSALMLGLVSFAGLIPTFFLSPVAGVLIDRWNKHQVLIITQVLATLQSAILAYLTLSGKITIHQLIVLSIVQGFINAFEFPVRQSFVVQLINDKKDLPNAIALNSSMQNLARLIGPSFAGILIAIFGEGGCFAIDAVSYLAVIATLVMMKLPKHNNPNNSQKKNKIHHELREGFQYAKNSPAIVAVLLLLGLISFMGMPYTTLLPMVVSKQLTGDSRMLGYLTAASGCGALVGALYLAAKKSVTSLALNNSIAAITFGAGLILFAVSHNFWFALPMMFIAGLGMMVQAASSNTILQAIVDENKRGRIMSLFVMTYAGFAPFGSLLGGFVADRIGAAHTLEFGGAICCLGGFVFLYILPNIQKEIMARSQN